MSPDVDARPGGGGAGPKPGGGSGTGPGGGAGTSPQPSHPPSNPPPTKYIPLLAIVAGTVLATAGIVSFQSGSPLRSTALLFAMALLFAGGLYGQAVLGGRRSA